MADLMKMLRRELQKSTQTALAAQLGVSIGQLNDVLHGRRKPSDELLSALGLRRVVRETYERIPSGEGGDS